MSDPLEIACADLDSLPPDAELAASANRNRHVVLIFPSHTEEASLRGAAEALQQRLPALSVFAALSNRPVISLIRVVSADVVMAHAQEFYTAALAFRSLATKLADRVARAHSVDQLDESFRLGRGSARRGSIEGDWQFAFHGHECCFTHQRTGQTLDVQLEFGGEFGVLDPWFFHTFLETTEEFRSLAKLLPDAFHDTARALDLLVEAGVLRTVVAPRLGTTGPVAMPDERPADTSRRGPTGR